MNIPSPYVFQGEGQGGVIVLWLIANIPVGLHKEGATTTVIPTKAETIGPNCQNRSKITTL